MKLKYVFLTLSLIETAIGLSDARQNIFFYLGLPIGAILLGLFLIAQVLEKESALYDEQNRALELAPERNPGPWQRSSIPQEVAHHPDPTAARPS